MTTQDGDGLKDHNDGGNSGGTNTAVDWDAINASIRVKAWRGFKAGLYPRQDLRDVEQDLTVWVLERLETFDPDRGTLATFLKHALRSGLGIIVRRANAAFRSLPDDADMTSFGAMVDTSEGPPVAVSETLTLEDLVRRTAACPRSAAEQFEIADDFEAVIAGLSDKQVEVARLLMTHSMTRAHAESGLTIAHFKATVQEIAQRFTVGGYELSDVVVDE